MFEVVVIKNLGKIGQCIFDLQKSPFFLNCETLKFAMPPQAHSSTETQKPSNLAVGCSLD